MTALRLAAVAHWGTIACAARNVATPTALATPIPIPSAASSRRPGTGAGVVVAVVVVAVMVVAVMVCSFGCGQVDVLRSGVGCSSVFWQQRRGGDQPRQT